jgi:hypothetical protein
LAAQYPPPTTYPRRRRGGVVGPLVLIFLGCVFLLQNIGYLPSNFWLGLWRLWPVILVLVGIELLFASRVPWLLLAALSAAILVFGAFWTNSRALTGAPPERISTTQSVDLGTAGQAAVNVRFDAGELNIAAIEQAAPAQLATMSYAGPENVLPRPNYSVSGNNGRLDLSTEDRDNRMFTPFTPDTSGTPRLDLGLSPNVPISTLSIKSGASNARLDLSTLNVRDVDASIGAASAWIRVPQAGTSTLRISGGASDITIEVPQGVAARLRFRVGLSTISVDPTRFPTSGEHQYQSPDFATNPNSVDVTVDAGVTKIQVS